MNGYDYEYVVAQYLKKQGYKNVNVTKASGDYGIDITAYKDEHKYAVQCKCYSQPVGISAVQEVVAGKAMYNCDKAMVVTNNTYTNAAIELARKNDVVLLSGVSSEKSSFSVKNATTNTNQNGCANCGCLFFIAVFIMAFIAAMLEG